MKYRIQKLITEALENFDIEKVDFSIEHPEDFKNGDYSTNVAMVCSKKIKINPKELAEKIKVELEKNLPKEIEKIEAKNGFINFYLSREFFKESVREILRKEKHWGKNDLLVDKKVMVEYTQPNPFKPFHIGHLMSNAIGESISRIVEFSGAKIVRANYQGDVGPHVAKAIYGILKNKNDTNSAWAENVSLSEKAKFIGECYSKGSNLYDTDENIKKEIDEINKKIYNRSDKKINKIYDWGRKITLDAFEEIYKILGTKFDKYYFESKVAPIGEKIVRKNVGKIGDPEHSRRIFEESDGAIVFHGEKYDPKLHTRVFINSQGLPTYETKELGLTIFKFKTGFGQRLDLSIVVTAIEQADYMKVVQKAIALIHPHFEDKIKHITHGMMRFADGKMSSRAGNIITGESLLSDSITVIKEKMTEREFSEEEKQKIAQIVGVSAIKYSILKSSIGSDIIYDFEKSISFDGDSGPYLQYTAVRANSLLNKAKDFIGSSRSDLGNSKRSDLFPPEIINLEKMLYQFPEVVERLYQEFAPHHVATYLTELASEFNTFYGNTKILSEENKYAHYHLEIVKAFLQTMKNGLWLLGIEIPEKM